MANKKNGNKTWVFGAVVGAVAGAAYALWKTPMSGNELRSKLSTGPVNQNETTVSDTIHTQGVGGKILSKVEHTLAPMVGVELGKTANQNGSAVSTPAQPASTAPAATNSETHTAASFEASPTHVESTPAATGNESIRANRFAWGEPAPEAGAEVPKPTATATPEVAAPVVPPAQPVAVSTPETTSTGGTESIRAKRYAWGDPAPENVTAAETPGQTTAPAAAASPVEAVSDEAGTPGANMRKFPKLGGLDN